MTPRPVLVAGGGLAGLEAVATMRRLAGADQLPIALLAPFAEFSHRPMATQASVKHGTAWHVDLDRFARDERVHLVHGSLAAVDVDRGVATTADGSEVPYSALIVCVGARRGEWLAGAITFGLTEPGSGMSELFAELDRGVVGSVAFVLPEKAFWSPLLYDLALLTADHVRARGLKVRLSLVTPERAPLAELGPRASLAMRRRLCRDGIDFVAQGDPAEAKGDRVVTLPALSGPAIPGLPADAAGFLVTDDLGRVRGARDVYAAGDATAYPVKQAELTAREAQAAARTIVAAQVSLVPQRPFHPTLEGVLVPDEDLSPPRTRWWSIWWPPPTVAAATVSQYLGVREGIGGVADRDRPVSGIPVRLELSVVRTD